MRAEGQGELLRVFVGESDRWHGKPLYEVIVQLVRREGLAGATVLRGIEGFGADSRIHTSRILRLSEDLPVVIEIVDTADRIRGILPQLDEMITEGMVTLEKVRIIAYRGGESQIDRFQEDAASGLQEDPTGREDTKSGEPGER
jgi:PII-like signaling protein